MTQGNDAVAKACAGMVSELKGQGGTSPSLDSTDYKINSDTKSAHGFDLTGHGSGGKGK